MAIKEIPLELIDDNPYQTRLTYHKQDIDDLAHSIKTHGLLQVPLGRRKENKVELGFGHLRKRAFAKLAKDNPEKWGRMPIDIQDLSDDQMALFALEENLKQRGIAPIEVARAVDKYLTSFPGKTEVEVAEYLNMTKGNVSNMRRVLRLPEQVLEKINGGRINFHMGRELLIFAGLANEKDLMLEAIRGLRSEGHPYGEPATVEGMQKAVHRVAGQHFPALDKGMGGYSTEPLFDTRAAGCLECDRMTNTHPTKSQTNHWCTNRECWDKKQQDHKEKMAAEARAKMREDVLRKVTAVEAERKVGGNVSQAITEAEAPSEGLLTEQEAAVFEGAIVAEDETERARIAQVAQLSPDYPCHGCLNVKRCDRTTVVAGEDGKLTCEQRLTKETAEALKKQATIPLPPEIEKLAAEKAGTRAEVLDLNGLWLDNWQRQLKQGYELLSYNLERITNPEECLERCTQGFHYAFDSRKTTGEVMYVCTNTKCLSKKKAAFTREKHATGMARKKAEAAAIKHAIDDTTALDRPRMKLILLAQLQGHHLISSFYGGSQKWLWERLKIAESFGRTYSIKALLEAIDKLTDEDLAKLIVEFMLTMLTYTGDIETYRIETTQPLGWMGIKVTVEGGK